MMEKSVERQAWVGKAGGGEEDGQEVCSAEHGSAMKGGGRVEGM